MYITPEVVDLEQTTLNCQMNFYSNDSRTRRYNIVTYMYKAKNSNQISNPIQYLHNKLNMTFI